MRVSQKVFLDAPDQVYIRRVMQRSKIFDGFIDALIYAITFNVIKKKFETRARASLLT